MQGEGFTSKNSFEDHTTDYYECNSDPKKHIHQKCLFILYIHTNDLSTLNVHCLGRPGGNRTPNLRFWRPSLYQLSYWPKLYYTASLQISVGCDQKEARLSFKRASLLKIFWIQIPSINYSMILETTPEPTVRPPSRIANRNPSSIAIGAINVPVIRMLSPGITISTPSDNATSPVMSVVRK